MAVEAGWPDEGVAAHYGDPLREQRATEESAGVVDRSNRGVVRITGPDRLSWLHSLTTQQLDGLAAGAAAQALILSPNGHVEHHLTLTDDGTATWLHVEPGTAAALVEFLESMRFMLRVEVADVSRDYAVLTVLGPAAGDIAAGLDGVPASVKPGPFGTIDLIVARDRLAGAAGDLVRRGAAAAGMWAFEALRIAAHVPRLGLDTDHRTIPHEVGWIDERRAPEQGLLPGPGDGGAGAQPRPPAAAAGLPEPGRQRGPAARARRPGRARRRGAGHVVGFTGSAARHYELGPIGLALVKRTVPVDATLLAGGVAAAQEVIVPPDAGANVKVTLRRRQLM